VLCAPKPPSHPPGFRGHAGISRTYCGVEAVVSRPGPQRAGRGLGPLGPQNTIYHSTHGHTMADVSRAHGVSASSLALFAARFQGKNSRIRLHRTNTRQGAARKRDGHQAHLRNQAAGEKIELEGRDGASASCWRPRTKGLRRGKALSRRFGRRPGTDQTFSGKKPPSTYSAGPSPGRLKPRHPTLPPWLIKTQGARFVRLSHYNILGTFSKTQMPLVFKGFRPAPRREGSRAMGWRVERTWCARRHQAESEASYLWV